MEMFFVPLALLLALTPILSIVALVLVTRLERRVRALEREKWLAAPAAAPQPARPDVTLTAPRPPVQPGPPPAPPLARAPLPPPAAAPGDAATPPRSGGGDLEVRLGIRWFNIVGIVTLLFGIAFFLKYAYDNAWIGPRGRVAIGVVGGIAGILLAEAARRRGHAVFSQGLTGGGLATLYLSFFFSFRLYHLIEIAPAFALMAAVLALGVALAVLQDSLAVAMVSFLGGYLTPILLSTGQDAAGFLFSYLTVLALGALAVTWFRRWRALEILAFAGTCLLYAGWYDAHYARGRLAVALIGLAVFFVIFLVLPYGHDLVRRVRSGPKEHILALANAVFAFTYLYRMVHPLNPTALGFIALAMAAAYLLLGVAARARMPDDAAMTITVLGISLAFVTMAIPLQLGLHGITLAWTAQGLLVVHLGFRYRAVLARLAGLAILGLAVVRLFARHLPLHAKPFTLFVNPTFATWLVVALALAAAAWLHRRHAARLSGEEARLAAGAFAPAVLLMMLSFTLEVGQFTHLWRWSLDRQAGAMMLLWATAPCLFLLVGRWFRDAGIRIAAVALVFAAAIPLLAVTGRVTANYDPLFGSFVFWAGMAGVASLFAAAALLRAMPGSTPGATAGLAGVAVHRLLAGLGVVLLLALMTAEIHSHFLLQPGPPEAAARNTLRALLSVSVLWGAYASALMAIGFRQGDRGCRLAAVALFCLTVVKVFLVDVWELREVYRIVSFIVLGLLLVVASFVYSRFRSRIVAGGGVVLLALLAGGEVAAAVDTTGWRYVRELDAGPAAGGGFAWVALDDVVLAGARADLADLRVLDADGAEVPYVLYARRSAAVEESWNAKLMNRGRLADGGASIDVIFETRAPRNLISVRTPGDDFRRRVEVLGSDDGLAWLPIVEEASVYSIPASPGFAATRREEIDLPLNDHPRLRVRVHPMPDDAKPLTIVSVEARRRLSRDPESAPLRVSHFVARHDAERRVTEVDIDFGYRHARPLRLDFEFGEEAFRRPWRLLGRNELRVSATVGRTETGDPIVREEDAPWRPLATGVLFRLPARRAGEAPIDATSIDLDDAVARHLRLVIEDRDDRPLTLRGVRAVSRVQRLIVPARAPGAYSLYYGNPEAPAPVYDLRSLLPDLEEHPPATGVLGKERENPLHGGAPGPAFSERHGLLLWTALILAVLTLVWLVKRNLPRRTG